MTTAAIAFLAGCSNEVTKDAATSPSTNQSAQQAEIGRAFEMKVGESVTVGELRLTLDAVKNDSRCPTDVVCVWAGDAEIGLRIQQGSQVATAELHTTLEPRHVEWNGYDVRFVALTPAPRSDKPTAPADYRAQIIVTR